MSESPLNIEPPRKDSIPKGHAPIQYVDGKYICPERGLVVPQFQIGPESYQRDLFIEYERSFGRGIAKDITHGIVPLPLGAHQMISGLYGENPIEEYRAISGKAIGLMARGSQEDVGSMIQEIRKYRAKHSGLYNDVKDPNAPKKTFKIIDSKE